jgi:hypothetical protein
MKFFIFNVTSECILLDVTTEIILTAIGKMQETISNWL